MDTVLVLFIELVCWVMVDGIARELVEVIMGGIGRHQLTMLPGVNVTTVSRTP